MKVDPGYHHMIDSLGELAFHALNVLSSALLQWKASQHTSPASLRAKMYLYNFYYLHFLFCLFIYLFIIVVFVCYGCG